MAGAEKFAEVVNRWRRGTERRRSWIITSTSFHPAVSGLAPDTGTVTADELVEHLDAAGIRRALVLSVAYQFGNPNRPALEDEYVKVRAGDPRLHYGIKLHFGNSDVDLEMPGT